jgi:hypothetical protein
VNPVNRLSAYLTVHCHGVSSADTIWHSGGQEVDMLRIRSFWALLSAVIGLLQAWDSGAFGAGPLVLSLTVVGIAIVSLAIAATTNQTVRFIALASAFVLLTLARAAAPFSLNTLHLSLFVPAIYMLVAFRWFEQNSSPVQAR